MILRSVKEQGKVLKLLDNGLARVQFVSSPACVKCGICRDTGENIFLVAKNEAGAGVGDAVEVFIPEGTVFGAMILMFILPIVALMAGYYVGGIPIAFGFLGLSLFGLIVYDRFFRSKKVTCRIIKKL